MADEPLTGRAGRPGSLLEHEGAVDLAEAVAGLPAALIGVRCPVDVLTRREVARADRTVGQAAAQDPVVHAHGGYDLEVDTSRLTPEQAAKAVMTWLAGRPGLTAFGRLRAGDPTAAAGAGP